MKLLLSCEMRLLPLEAGRVSGGSNFCYVDSLILWRFKRV